MSTEGHLSAERIQAFLDGLASPEEAARVQEHVAACGRCRAEVEAWDALFEGLGTWADVSPVPETRLAERVLAALPASPPPRAFPARAAARLWSRLAPGADRPPATHPAHLPPERIQDLLEGRLPRRDALSAQGHLHACQACRLEAQAWRTFLAGIGELPALTPSPGFAERVMAHVRIQLALAAAHPTPAERVRLLVRSVSPRTRRRVAALAGAGVTPGVTLALMVYTVFSRPMVTVGGLGSFLWLQGSDALALWLGGLAERSGGIPALLGAASTLDSVSGSPVSLALTVAGLGCVLLASSWVLYRNVLTTPTVQRSDAR